MSLIHRAITKDRLFIFDPVVAMIWDTAGNPFVIALDLRYSLLPVFSQETY